jgi:cytochrome c556
MKPRLAAPFLALVLLGTGAAALAASPGDTIRAREANFKQLGKGMKATMDQLKSGSPDLAVIRAAAAQIVPAAQHVPGLFPKGTGPESGVKTEALPEIWTKPMEFRTATDKLTSAATAFKAAADAGDLTRIKAATMALGGSCKGCHDSFRQKD